MENKITIDLDRYNQLLITEMELQLAKQILFNENNCLSYDKKGVRFELSADQVKLAFPCDYRLHLIGLTRKEEENV